MKMETGRNFAQKMDQADDLRSFRDKFHIPKVPNGKDQVYLCGNSLGLQPKSVRDFLEQELDDWARQAVAGHLAAKRPWLSYHEQFSKPLAKIMGAKPSEVVAMNSLTVNLHLLMISFYRPTKTRFKILVEEKSFPSDLYAIESQIEFHGFSAKDAVLKISPRKNESTLRTEDIESLIRQEGKSIALILLPGVQYFTGQAFEIERLTKIAHSEGCLIGFDLAHAAGNIILKLHDWNVDFAVWCSYKYLNAGPGSVGGAFIHETLSDQPDLPRLKGWWGHDKKTRFTMPSKFVSLSGAEGWQISNPPIFSLTPLLASLELFEMAGMEKLRKKSQALTSYLEFLLGQNKSINILTPQSPAERGCQLSIQIFSEEKKKIYLALCEKGIIGDWREPDVIRMTPVPLYNSFEDVFSAAEALLKLL